MSEIMENIAAVRARIAAAAESAGRDPREILLVGASKMNDAAACRAAIAGGLTALGENRVQELLEKDAQGAYAGATLHFIGRLQRNKVKYLVGRADLIESIDSLPLLQEVQRLAEKRGVTQDILLEVSAAGEESKGGLPMAEVTPTAEAALGMPNVRVRGLMTIPPVCTDPRESRPYFEKVRALYVDINAKLFHNELEYLSMGMSADFEEAIRAGATVVRVGTAIFGRRNYGAAPG